VTSTKSYINSTQYLPTHLHINPEYTSYKYVNYFVYCITIITVNTIILCFDYYNIHKSTSITKIHHIHFEFASLPLKCLQKQNTIPKWVISYNTKQKINITVKHYKMFRCFTQCPTL